MRTARITAPDGREWKVRAFRVRLPPWRQIDLWGDTDPLRDSFDLVSIVLGLITLPLTLVLFPLALFLLELPVALGRALSAHTVWVEAATYWPREERMLWRTSPSDAPGVHASVAAQLSAGDHVRPMRAELVEHSTA